MKRLDGTALYMVGMLVTEKEDLEAQLSLLVSSAKEFREYDSIESKEIHEKIKQRTTEYARVLNELETLKKLEL